MPAANSVVKVLTYPSCFRLVVGNDQSDAVEYGALVELESGGKVYGACFDLEGSQTTSPVWEARPVANVIVSPELEDPADWDSEDDGDDEDEDEDEGDEVDDGDDEAEA